MTIVTMYTDFDSYQNKHVSWEIYNHL